MKTSRILRKNNPENHSSQGKKTAIHGQITATIGPEKIDTTGKVTLEAVRIGAEIGFDDNQIKSLALIADYEGVTPTELVKDALLSLLQASVEKAEEQIATGKTTEEKAPAANLLRALPPIFRRSDPASHTNDMGDAKMVLDEAVRQSHAFQLMMLIAIESECVELFKNDRGYLAADVQTLMYRVRDDLDNANDAINRASRHGVS